MSVLRCAFALQAISYRVTRKRIILSYISFLSLALAQLLLRCPRLATSNKGKEGGEESYMAMKVLSLEEGDGGEEREIVDEEYLVEVCQEWVETLTRDFPHAHTLGAASADCSGGRSTGAGRRGDVCGGRYTATALRCSNTLQYTATHYNTRQHTATHCNTLQHTATHSDEP